MTWAMQRPQIKPHIFLALQNAMATLLFAILLATEMMRHLLYENPSSETLWWLTSLANRSVMPMLQYVNQMLPVPDQLLAGLAAGVIVPLLAWWTRYWLVTAVSGHLVLGALIVLTLQHFPKGSVSLASLGLGGWVLAALSLFVLVMCIADHVAFVRFVASLWTYLRRNRC